MISLNRGSLYRGSVSYILLLLYGQAEENRSLYQGLCYIEVCQINGSTVTRLLIGGLNCTVL